MKTFSEAVEFTMMRKGPPPGETEDARAIFDQIALGQESYAAIHEEIQQSEEATAFAVGLMESAEDMETEDLIRIAFSHGVMVGIEMEKAE
jgi:hypothetical protein